MMVRTDMVLRALTAMEVAHNDPNMTSYGAMRRALEAALGDDQPMSANEAAREEYMLGLITASQYERRIRV